MSTSAAASASSKPAGQGIESLTASFDAMSTTFFQDIVNVLPINEQFKEQEFYVPNVGTPRWPQLFDNQVINADKVHRQYRGEDVPEFKDSAKTEKKRSLNIATNTRPCTLTINDLVTLEDNPHKLTFGHITMFESDDAKKRSKAQKSGSDKSRPKVDPMAMRDPAKEQNIDDSSSDEEAPLHWTRQVLLKHRMWLDTQYAHITTSFKRRVGSVDQDVEMHIFGSMLCRGAPLQLFVQGLDQDYPDNAGFHSAGIAETIPPRGTGENQEQLHSGFAKGQMAVLGMKLKKGGKVHWTGISDSDLAEISNKLMDDEPLSPADRMIGYLSRATEFTFHHWLDLTSATEKASLRVAWHSMLEYLYSLLKINSLYGSMWYWRTNYAYSQAMQIHGDLEKCGIAQFTQYCDEAFTEKSEAMAYPFDKLASPRWLIELWVKEISSGQTTFRAAAVEAFRMPPVWPAENDCLFMSRIDNARSQAADNNKVFSLAMKSSNTTTMATFEKSSGAKANPKGYIIRVHIAKPEDRFVLETGTAVSVAVSVPGAVGKNRRPRHLTGTVFSVDERDCDILILATGDPKLGEQLGDSAKLHEVQLIFETQDASTSRQDAALCRIMQGQSRTTGVDVRSLLFGFDRPKKNTQHDTLKNMNLGEEWIKTVRQVRPALNTEQRKVATHPVNTSGHKDVTIIHGPPGTGKTVTTQSAAKGAVQESLRVAVVSASNQGVNAAMMKYLDLTKGAPRGTPAGDFYAVRFSRTFYSKRNHKIQTDDEIRDATLSEQLEAELTLFELQDLYEGEKGDEELAMHSYGVVKERWLKRCADHAANKEKDESEGTASLLFDLRKQIGTARQDKEFSSAKLSQLELQEKSVIWETDKLFLHKKVRIVFVTANTSCHDVLRLLFFPDVLIFEEAGQASLRDAAVPFATWIESVKHTIISGDHLQLGPVVSDKHNNEAFKVSVHSLFESLVKDGKQRYQVVRLDKQYRMHESIAELPGRLMYSDDDGKTTWLKTDKDATATHGIDPSLLAWLEPLKKFGWAGDAQRRISINVKDGYSYPRNSSSKINEGEADLIVELLKSAKAAGVDMEKYSVGVITPYTQQKKLIIRKLRVAGIKNVKVVTTSSTQGGQFDFVILSLVSHKPTDPMDIGWLRLARMINVNESRAKRLQIVLGGWYGWIKALLSTDSAEWKKLNYNTMKAFKFMVLYNYEQNLVLEADSVKEALIVRSGTVPPGKTVAQSLRDNPKERFAVVKAGEQGLAVPSDVIRSIRPGMQDEWGTQKSSQRGAKTSKKQYSKLAADAESLSIKKDETKQRALIELLKQEWLDTQARLAAQRSLGLTAAEDKPDQKMDGVEETPAVEDEAPEEGEIKDGDAMEVETPQETASKEPENGQKDETGKGLSRKQRKAAAKAAKAAESPAGS